MTPRGSGDGGRAGWDGLRVATVLGARPQFIKAAPVSRALRAAGHRESVLHTGQHYDYGMSGVFFEQLPVPVPDVNLGVGSGPHGEQTARMLAGLEEVLERERPDWVLVYGDTNSTLAGALAACKIGLPLAHVEAGLRSFNRSMPEEHNRVLTDHCSDLLLCPTPTAVRNLEREGIRQEVALVGDTMYDVLLASLERSEREDALLDRLRISPGAYCLATVHRPYNTDDEENLRSIFAAFAEMDEPVVLPLHPRTRRRLGEARVLESLGGEPANLHLLEPVGYLEMLVLERHARLILTDSGGVQKEAFLLGVPCVTLRPETEWVETVEAGWNVVVGADRQSILDAVRGRRWPAGDPPPTFGDGTAGPKIVERLAAGR